MADAIQAEGLVKSFGETRALRGIDLSVPAGSVLGLLGPNGAGKTTAVRILTTLLSFDGGRAQVAGYDVARQAGEVRRVIGLTGQYAAVDELLTGRENLEMIGRLLGLSRSRALARGDELLERFELSDAARRPARTYSGGMRRRLDLAASLVGQPEVLFLDEPTTGLDPRSRDGLWAVIGELVREGTTVLLTTQYLEEADVLADTIAIIDGGQVIARGTADELKAQTGGQVLELQPANAGDLDRAVAALSSLGRGDLQVDRETGRLRLPVTGDSSFLAAAVRRLDEAGIGLADLGLRRPSLDDVFLTLTGRTAEATTDATAATDATAGTGATDQPGPASSGRRSRRKAA